MSGRSPSGRATHERSRVTPSPPTVGIPNAHDVDDAVEAWHMGAGPGQSLHKYLGWSFDEYAMWVRDQNAIPQRPLASGTEAGTGETVGLDPKGDGPVGKAETLNNLQQGTGNDE